MSNQHNRRDNVEAADESEAADQGSAAHISGQLGPATSVGPAPAGRMRAGEAGSIADTDDSEWGIEVGSDGIGQCGHKGGEVVAVREDVIVVERGFFMPMDFYIPKSAIQRNNDHGLYLNVTKNDALHRGWDVDPHLRHAS
ncbi:hypothetical protein BH24CHL3_BH24CHL3_04710 [soil metagenome]